MQLCLKTRRWQKLGSYGLNEGWLISASEVDLIKAIGTDFIHKDTNKVDLLRKTGLSIRDEIAPAKLIGEKDNYPEIERADEWGEDSRPYIDNRSILDRLISEPSIINIILLLIFWPTFVSMLISDNISSRANQGVSLTLFIILPGIVAFLSSGDCILLCSYGWWIREIFSVLLGIYFFIVLFPFLHHTYNDKSL